MNRKLYDTKNHKYITLSGITSLIKNGTIIQVIDNVSKNDITDKTLAQCISDNVSEYSRDDLLEFLGR